MEKYGRGQRASVLFIFSPVPSYQLRSLYTAFPSGDTGERLAQLLQEAKKMSMTHTVSLVIPVPSLPFNACAHACLGCVYYCKEFTGAIHPVLYDPASLPVD